MKHKHGWNIAINIMSLKHLYTNDAQKETTQNVFVLFKTINLDSQLHNLSMSPPVLM